MGPPYLGRRRKAVLLLAAFSGCTAGRALRWGGGWGAKVKRQVVCVCVCGGLFNLTGGGGVGLLYIFLNSFPIQFSLSSRLGRWGRA